MTRRDFLSKVETYYTSALSRHGATPRGVDWSSEESQRLRFDQLAKIWEGRGSETFSVIDYGCGYGALVPYLRERGLAFAYTGFDISPEMIATARQLHGGPGAVFVSDEAELPTAD